MLFAVVEAVLAAAVVGVFEGALVASTWGARVVPVVAGVAMLGALGATLLLRGAIAILGRSELVGGWARAVMLPGQPRVVAVWRGVLGLVALAVFGLVAFRAFTWVHARFRFNDGAAIGLVFVVAMIVLVTGVLVGVMALDARVRGRLPAGTLDGRRFHVLAGVAAVALIVVPTFVVERAVPAATASYVLVGSVLVLAVLAAHIARVGRRRVAQIVAVVVVLGAVVGTWLLSSAARARGAIVEVGVASEPVARAIRALADGDGDGYASSGVGGADCDDGNAARSPGAADVPGNGIDDNCTGADVAPTALGLRMEARPVPPAMTKPNILLISIDALRADHLGSYGYGRKTSPALDALAASGVRFAQAYTSCPSTRCAIPSLHTGRYASTLGSGPARDAIPNLARVLRDAGWTTTAISCCDRFALARQEMSGFQVIDASADTVRMQRAGQSNADTVTETTLLWFHSRDKTKPYFDWIHLYDPHFPYEAPSGPDFGDDDIDRYDREIAFVDSQLARVFAAVDPNTIIVITADHGDEFGEHGIRFHARSLYNQVVRVPLIVRVPGVAPRVVDTPVSIVDVMPTLLDLVGVEGPRGMNGRTLVPALRGGLAPQRPVFIELMHDHQIKRDMAAVVSAPWKVIWDREANVWSLYRLDDAADANERSDDAALPELKKLLLETLDRETAVLPR